MCRKGVLMTKADLKNDCEKIIESLTDGSVGPYGYGEFCEGTIPELIPFLNKDGLTFLKSELKLCFKNELDELEKIT
jgi:hypothetical protein